jgi:hypothetical protein
MNPQNHLPDPPKHDKNHDPKKRPFRVFFTLFHKKHTNTAISIDRCLDQRCFSIQIVLKTPIFTKSLFFTKIHQNMTILGVFM